MRPRTFLTTFVVAASFALSAFALSSDYLEWGRGPASYLMTKDEAAQWKTITSDDDAKAFVTLFWARRDPTPATPRNEFREEYERRVATADKSFAIDKGRGAMTDRGKMLILFGRPKKIEGGNNQRQGSMPGMTGGLGDRGTLQGAPTLGNGVATGTPSNMDDFTAGGATATDEGQIWTYEGEGTSAIFPTARAQLRFVDKDGKGKFILQRGGVDVGAAERKAIEKAIVRPNLTMADLATAPAPAAAAAAAAMPIPETPAAPLELTTESLKAAVAEFKAAAKSPYSKQSYATWGEYVTADGETFVPVQVYVPKSAGITAGQPLTFFGVVQDESGKSVAAFEEPARLVASKDDLFVDRSLTMLPAGKYRGYFGLAENGKPLTLVSADMQLAGSLDKAATGVSPLILSNNVYPLTEAQKVDDPYAFGGLKVVPKGDKVFRNTDDLWYFVELRNPGVAEAPATTEGAVSIGGATMPKVQIKIDVEGTDNTGKKIKMAAPPREIEAAEIKGVPGHYALGNAIPLASFKPGEYTFNVKVIDTVKKTSYTMTDKFRVVE
jgi:GWxTD domain-containing protein